MHTLNPLSDELPFFPPCTFFLIFFFIIIFSRHFLSIIFLHLLIISPYYLSSTIPSSPDLLSKLVRPLECRCLDTEAPIPSTSQVQRQPVNFFTGGAGRKFQGALIQKHTLILALSCLRTILHLSFFLPSPPFPHIFLATPLLLPHSLSLTRASLSFPPSPRLSSPVSKLSLADAPDGSIILEHLSAVCLHHGSSAATGATGK